MVAERVELIADAPVSDFIAKQALEERPHERWATEMKLLGSQDRGADAIEFIASQGRGWNDPLNVAVVRAKYRCRKLQSDQSE
jgi:hypothetical protein